MTEKYLTDRRILKSKAIILSSLLQLMEEKEFKDISIIDVTEKANVARPTFYRNYQSLEDILIQEMDQQYALFIDRVKKKIAAGTRPNIILRQIFYTWQKNDKLFDALIKAEADSQILEHFDKYAGILLNELLKNKKPKNFSYLMHYFAGGTFLVLKSWFKEGKKTKISVLSELLTKNLLCIAEQSCQNIK